MKNEEKIIRMIEKLDTKVTGINKDIGEMKTDIAVLKSDVGSLKYQFAEMKSSQDTMAETIVEMDRYMHEELATKADLKQHDVRITRLERLQGIA